MQFGLDGDFLKLKPEVKALSFKSFTIICTIKLPEEGDYIVQFEENFEASDLLFLTFHKEKPSPSGASVRLLYQ